MAKGQILTKKWTAIFLGWPIKMGNPGHCLALDFPSVPERFWGHQGPPYSNPSPSANGLLHGSPFSASLAPQSELLHATSLSLLLDAAVSIRSQLLFPVVSAPIRSHLSFRSQLAYITFSVPICSQLLLQISAAFSAPICSHLLLQISACIHSLLCTHNQHHSLADLSFLTQPSHPSPTSDFTWPILNMEPLKTLRVHSSIENRSSLPAQETRASLMQIMLRRS